jgi:gamma-glutamyltranspeptidase / glutathione hydrolase
VEPAHLDGVTNNSEGNDTIYLSVIDKDGNIVSLIQSIYSGFGTGLVPEGTGFALHNRGQLFTLEPNHVNTLAPRKRPVHTIIPAFLRKDDCARAGCPAPRVASRNSVHFTMNTTEYGSIIDATVPIPAFFT